MSRSFAILTTLTLAACTPAPVLQGDSAVAVGVASPPRTLEYPVTARVGVADDYAGTRVNDPYRWLENLDSDVTRQWVQAQNALSQPRLDRLPQRAWVKRRLTELWNYERFGAPVKAGSRYFFLRNDGTQNQSVLFVADQVDAPGGQVEARQRRDAAE